MTLSKELAWRGFINQSTFTDITDLDKKKLKFYMGVDPSADSMQIGNLAACMMFRHFLNYGYDGVFLVGGATGLIGDPDGKKQERDIKDSLTIKRNSELLKKQISKLFINDDVEIVDNIDWFSGVRYMDFLREVGKNVSMTQLLDRDFIKTRIGEGGSGISYAEFSYALIQGYDFLHLYRNHGVKLQLAGSDQWGNSVTGVDLIRKLDGGEAHVLTAPLVVNKQTGVKFGKSEGGAIWLDPEKTSPFKFYQFWLNCDDATSEDMIKIYTLLDKSTIEDIIDSHRANPGKRLLQKTLAREVTEFVHGRDRRESVERVTGVLFGDEHIDKLTDKDLDELSKEIPVVDKNTTISILVDSGVAKSNGDAKRLIASGAISVNGEKISQDFEINKKSLIKKGKNNFILVR